MCHLSVYAGHEDRHIKLTSSQFKGKRIDRWYVGMCVWTNEPGHEKMCLISYANNKVADQPAPPRSLISAFVGRCLDSIISLDSVAEI